MSFLKRTLVLIAVFALCLMQAAGKNYYINALNGNDANLGTKKTSAWQTVKPLNAVQLQPGDSVLFAAGQKFEGMLSLIDVQGTLAHPIVVSSYQIQAKTQKAILDAGKYLNVIFIQNSSNIHVSNLEITALLPYTNTSNSAALMQCGILVEVTKSQTYENIILHDLLVHDIFFHEKGFTRSAEEIKTANGTQSYGWGIRFINNSSEGKLNTIKVTNSEIYNVSHTGLKITSPVNGINDVEISQMKVHHTGGPGMQFSGVNHAHIHHNSIHHSGSPHDSRNWARGSGMWTWSCSDFVIEHNRFENANGPGDSAGVHIDYNCSDIIVQYNFSANNAGGFCEILGENQNCAYRYNISVNDGFRVKGEKGAFQEGKIFWLSGFRGDKKTPNGPFNSYFYNNTIYVDSTIIPKISISSSADGILIANNIFYLERPVTIVAGDQKKNESVSLPSTDIIFTNNLFLAADEWPQKFSFPNISLAIGDPLFKQKGGLALKDYQPMNKALVSGKGAAIEKIPNDTIGLKIGLKVSKDILGNPIPGTPDIGAIEIKNN